MPSAGPGLTSTRSAPHFKTGSGYWHLQLPSAFLVDLTVLDLASLSGDGTCAYKPRRKSLSALRGPMSLRATEVSRMWESFANDYSKNVLSLPDGHGKTWISKAVSGGFGDSPLMPTARVEGNEVKFNLKRTGRLLRPMSTEMLLRLHAYRSRAAFEHDFARSAAS